MMDMKAQVILRTSSLICLLLIFASSSSMGAGVGAAAAPVVLCESPGAMTELPDGTLTAFVIGRDHSCFSRDSTDGGRTWSKPRLAFDFPKRDAKQQVGVALPIVDHDGELHVFLTATRNEVDKAATSAGESKVRVKARRGRRYGIEICRDIWHCKTSNGRQTWSEPQLIFKGYVGAINGATQLADGKIVLPHQYAVPDRDFTPPTGNHEVTVTYSSDAGKTWKLSSAKLTAPCSADFVGNNYGACEPTIVQLKDGRAWMLMRTQTGFLYESFSTDGVHWSDAKPSRFRSSSSPASLVRVADGRIVVVWNNCEEPSRVDGKGLYVNRDVLHAAISDDEGKTWRGYREIYRDPLRNELTQLGGDRGTAYPFMTATKDGKIILTSGQGKSRRNVIEIDPDWLCQTHREDDFSNGLEGWCVFKPYGPVQRVFRARVPGATLVDHPSKPDAKVLHICRPDEKDGDDAIWNFPVGRKGKLTMRIMLQKGFAGAHIALADRFFYPGDEKVLTQSLFLLPITAAGTLPDGSKLDPNRWYTLDFQWDLQKSQCQVMVADREAYALEQISPDTVSPGVSYLRIRSTAQTTDPAGLFVESVRADVQ